MEDEAVVQETAAEHEKYLLIEQLVKLGMLIHGTSRSRVKALLGKPDRQGCTSRRYRTPKIYRYGRVEIAFGSRAKDGIQMIYLDMPGNCSVPILPPAETKKDAPMSNQKNMIGDVLCPPGSRGEAMEHEFSDLVDEHNKGINCPLCNHHILGVKPVLPMFEMEVGPTLSLKEVIARRFGKSAVRKSPMLKKSLRLKKIRAQILRLAKRYEKALKGPPSEQPASSLPSSSTSWKADMLQDKLFPELRGRRWGYVNFGMASLGVVKEPNPLLNPDVCKVWKQMIHEGTGIDFSHGGYLEDRNHMWRGSYLQPAGAYHLGIDLTVPEGTMVHLPCAAILHSAGHDPDQAGGWGGKAVFKLPEGLFVIFGHLDLAAYLLVHQRQYMSGDVIGQVAPSTRNGGWDPHLHVQIVSGLNPDIVDGYSSMYATIRQDFPDPEEVLGIAI